MAGTAGPTARTESARATGGTRAERLLPPGPSIRQRTFRARAVRARPVEAGAFRARAVGTRPAERRTATCVGPSRPPRRARALETRTHRARTLETRPRRARTIRARSFEARSVGPMALGTRLLAVGLTPAGVVVPAPFRAGLVSAVRQVCFRPFWFGRRIERLRFGRARSRRGLLGATPALPVARVFHLDTLLGKHLSESIRAGPILVGAGCGSLVKQCLQFGLQ